MGCERKDDSSVDRCFHLFPSAFNALFMTSRYRASVRDLGSGANSRMGWARARIFAQKSVAGGNGEKSPRSALAHSVDATSRMCGTYHPAAYSYWWERQ
jgi:hypothetical protein